MKCTSIELGIVFPVLFIWSSLSSGLLATKSKKSHCPHNLFSDVNGWDENSKCVAIWEGKFVGTHYNFNELCNERIPKATAANVLPKWDVLMTANGKSSVFLGVRIKSGFCSKKICFALMADAGESTDLILYNEETLEILYSTKRGSSLPENIQHLNLSLSTNRQYCLLLVGNLIRAVSCSKRPLTVDRLVCETDQLNYCTLTAEKRNFSSLCLCKQPRMGPLCAKSEIEDRREAKYEPDKFNGLLIGYCAILVAITLFFLCIIHKIKKQVQALNLFSLILHS
ncbi:hypothetical protein D918_06240 [Trichuris suis]|nr:hypothetical protein D918_06240 [Trichuris suis]